MNKYPTITEERIRRAIPRFAALMYGPRENLTVQAWHVRGEPVPVEVALKAKYKAFAVGDRWGGLWDTTWFRFRGKVPISWAGRKIVALVRLTDCEYEGFTAEGLIYRDAKVFRALNVHRREVDLVARAKGGEELEFFVEAAANGGTGDTIHGVGLPDYHGSPRFALKEADLVWVNAAAHDLYYDFTVAAEAMEVFPEGSQRRAELREALNGAVNVLDSAGMPDSAVAVDHVVRDARAALVQVMERPNGGTVHTVSGVGHAHIDTAWRWPLRESIRKCARTFSTALDNMRRYPEFVFACSQPQQYAWMKAYYPQIWAGIKRAVKAGQWEPIGSMWVEPDCNLLSGESLVRQILYGKRFFREEFGKDTRDAWLPDVFGYSASLPQILRKAGIDYFLSQKISWNQFNKFPHHTFLWEGIDGTRIFTHFPPVDDYNADTGARFLRRAADQFREHGRATRSLLPYGYGDGGGGPSVAMLETARRLRNFDGLPRLEQEGVLAFFERAVDDAIDPAVWVGDLYLETHRGTLTSQARIKRANRECEFLLRDADFLDALTCVLVPGRREAAKDPTRAIYDVTGMGAAANGRYSAALERAWKLLLLNQFHDILPGSSIHMVYNDAVRDYATIRELAGSVVEDAFTTFAALVESSGFAKPVLVLNTFGFRRSEVITLPGGGVRHVDVPPFGYVVVEDQDVLVEGETPAWAESILAPAQVISDGKRHVLLNGEVRVEVTTDGRVVGIRDLRRGRELLVSGQEGNQFRLHPDYPNRFNAWDVDIFHRETGCTLDEVESVDIEATGPLRASIRIVRCFGESRLTQRIILHQGSARIDFETEVDWNEDQKLLKVAFPVAVHSARATYEIPFGHIERPTHSNTSWDMAKFEVCGHKWADLSEPGFGVALLNDCKYGYAIHGNVMQLSLLRAPISPDPLADRGTHRFTYAILPHGGDLRSAGVISEAYRLNAPLIIRAIHPHAGTLTSTNSFFVCEPDGMILDSVKVSEEGDGVVLRLFESHGARGRGRLRIGFQFAEAYWCDLMEEKSESALCDEGVIEFDFVPFELKTLRMVVKRNRLKPTARTSKR